MASDDSTKPKSLTEDELRLAEFELKRAELERKGNEPFWKTPIGLAIIGALATAFTAVVTNGLQGIADSNARTAQHAASMLQEKQKYELEQEAAAKQFQSELIQRSIERAPDNAAVETNLKFLAKAGLIPDYAEKINAIPADELPDRTTIGTGADTRERVATTDRPPYNAICLIESVSPNGTHLMATGFLVGPSTVVTAGHAVYNHNTRFGVGAMRSITVYFGRNEGDWVANADTTSTHTTKEWVNSGDPASDYAAIRLDHPVDSEVQPLRLAEVDDGKLAGSEVIVAGYPADKNNLIYGTMWRTAGSIISIEAGRITYQLTTGGGTAGAPVLRTDENTGATSVVAIHGYRSESGGIGVRVTAAVRERIEGWTR